MKTMKPMRTTSYNRKNLSRTSTKNINCYINIIMQCNIISISQQFINK